MSETTRRFYLMPALELTLDDDGRSYRGPMYLAWRYNPPTGGQEGVLSASWSAKDYGTVNVMLVVAEVTPEQHAILAERPDVYPFPQDLDQNVPQAALSALVGFLEAAYIPANWISGSDTWRTVLRIVTAMFLFMQRLSAVSAGTNPLQWGVTMNTQWRSIPTTYQAWIVEAFSSQGYDPSWIRSNTTIRQILKTAADRWGERPIFFGMETL